MREEYVKSLNAVADFNSALFNIVRNNVSTEDMESDRGSFIKITPDMQAMIKKIKLNVINIESLRRKDSKTEIDGGAIIRSLKMFERPGSVITWATIDDKSMATLFCCPKHIGNVLNDTLWNSAGHYVLMSGTMSDGKNFDYFKKENGLAHVRKDKLQSSSTSSPFDYANNARLYIPEDLPFPDSNISYEYIEKITDRIVELVRATNGHTAILFTSYKALNAVYEKAKDRLAKYRLIRMTRSNKTAIIEFKECDNAVLFASGSMWAGIDICGDRLSSVIIVRLPFPLRSATMEEKKSASANVSAFIDDYAVPEMLIKLRQGVGRLIRTETDTGLITILDPRAKKGSYAERIRKVMRKYPEVDTIGEIEEFFKTVKPAEYFEE
jgi:ATP-dependent DNA helicase DinG